ncbi:hypothetical protein EBZ37_05520 [bacterium]|nr:hypothetical protein [bacterium]
MHYLRGFRGQLIVFVLLMSHLMGCSWSRKNRNPIVEDLQLQPLGEVSLQKSGSDFETLRVRSTAKFLKSEILNREFLYGVDVQNSSIL